MSDRLALIVALLYLPFTGVSHAANVDTAIVFAVDSSASVGLDFAQLQRDGHAQALEAPEVVAAIRRGNVGCIAITYFEWLSSGRQHLVLPWSRICDADDAHKAAEAIRRNGAQRGFGRRTSLSFAIDHSSRMLDLLADTAPRKIIDISANGLNNDGSNVPQSRRNALDKGYVINAIVQAGKWGDPGLLDYFKESIIGGPVAFAISAETASDYTDALRRKLMTEISASTMPALR